MIGSIDMLAIRSRDPVISMAMTGRLSGSDANPPWSTFFARGGRLVSDIRNTVAKNDRKITPPAQKNVFRIPISGGKMPPIKGPTKLPAVIRLGRDQDHRSRGIAAQKSCQKPQRHQMPNIVCKTNQ